MKILASDMDGTLIIEKEIHPKDIEAINTFRKNGNKFIVSTGRTLKGAEIAIKEHNIEADYMVLCNGALVLDKNKDIIYKKIIPVKVLREIVSRFKNVDKLMIYFDDGKNFYIVKNSNADLDEISFFSDLNPIEISVEDALNFKNDIFIMSVFATDKDIEKAEAAKVIMEEMDMPCDKFRNQFFVDIAPKGCSKGNGLKEILRLENKEVKDLYTVGDSFNDISMFEITENSYTFNRAEEVIKEHTNNHIDYVYEIINSIGK